MRFAGGVSRVAPGANYAAGITEIRDNGTLDLDTDATTNALRMTGGARRGTGTLTVGNGQSSLEQATFTDPGLTSFTGGQTTITGTVLLYGGSHTVRLGGTTTWSAGSFQIIDAGVIENTGQLQVDGTVGVELYDGGGASGPREFRNVAGGVLTGDATIYGTIINASGVVAPGTLTIAGDYVQRAAGTLRVYVAAADHGKLTVWGTATLAGTLDLATAGGFDPPTTGTYRIVDAGVLTGAFATVSGAQVRPGKAFAVSYDGTGVAVGVTESPGGPPPAATVTAAPSPPTPTPTPAVQPAAPSPTPEILPPTTGKTVNATAERGSVTVRLPDGRTVPLEDATQIPTGSVLDTRAGAVRLAMRGANGKIESGVFSEGVFRVTQSTGAKPITELALTEKLDCPKNARAKAAAGKKRKRRLWGDATGNFRTRGRYGSAVNSGTKWMVEDRCDSTRVPRRPRRHPRQQDRLAQDGQRQGRPPVPDPSAVMRHRRALSLLAVVVLAAGAAGAMKQIGVGTRARTRDRRCALPAARAGRATSRRRARRRRRADADRAADALAVPALAAGASDRPSRRRPAAGDRDRPAVHRADRHR